MNNHSQKDVSDSSNEAPASIPQTTPKGIGYGHPEYQFVQSVMELQKHLGEINASIKSLEKSVDNTNSRIECLGDINASLRNLTQTTDSTKAKVDDLIKWKHMILGGMAVIGFVGACIFAGIKLFI